MTNKQLAAYEAKRNLGAELLQAAREISAGKATRVHHVQSDGRIVTVLNRRLKRRGRTKNKKRRSYEKGV